MFFFNYSWRQQEAHVAAGKDWLRVALAKRLKLPESVQQFWSYIREGNFRGNIDFGLQVSFGEPPTNILIQPLLEFRQMNGRQGKSNGVSVSTEARKQS